LCSDDEIIRTFDLGSQAVKVAILPEQGNNVNHDKQCSYIIGFQLACCGSADILLQTDYKINISSPIR